MKSLVKGKLGHGLTSKSQELQFYTFELELGLLMHPVLHRFLNRDSHQTKKKSLDKTCAHAFNKNKKII